MYVNELDSNALETYLVNREPEHPELRRFNSHDILELTQNDRELVDLRHALLSHYGLRDIDLVVGGPPCQGFSEIGLRRSFSVSKTDVPSNHLYREMAKAVAGLRPRMFLFENVRGLLSSRWTPDGEPGEIWRAVQQEFGALDGYDVRTAVVQARDFGVPQARPRVLLVGIRSDIGSLDAGKSDGGLLPSPQPGSSPPDPVDFLGDLVDPDYELEFATRTYPNDYLTDMQEWYRWDPRLGRARGRGEPVSDHTYSRHTTRIAEKFRHMIDNQGAIQPEHQTKKFRQPVIPARWGIKGPTITATSNPDDFVHFLQPRTLSVREWARMQTFPDWYQFTGNRTTGGRRRAGDPAAGIWKREVPKYTQIGNAVPVALAYALGSHFRELLG